MKAARPGTAVLIAVVTGAVGWYALRLWESSGRLAPPVPWTALAGLVALAVAVVASGLPVRRWRSGARQTRLDPLVAARTVVFAKAAVYGGALFAGWYAAQALAVLPDVVGGRRTRLVLAALSAVAGVAVVAAGFLVQHWCTLPPGDEDGQKDQDRPGAA